MKNPNSTENGKIYFSDIGDYLTREQKLEIIADFKSIKGIEDNGAWQVLTPDIHGDWLNQRDDSFYQFLKLGEKKEKNIPKLFESYSMGIKTNRDEWVYQYSQKKLESILASSINFYNLEVDRLSGQTKEEIELNLNRDKSKIKWTTDIQSDLVKGKKYTVNKEDIIQAIYRPFSKQWVYANKNWNWTRHLIPQYFPTGNSENKVIYISGVGNGGKAFTTLIVDLTPDLNLEHSGGQGFPLYLYEEVTQEKNVGSGDLFDESLDLTVTETKYERKDGISDEGLQHFQTAYPNEQITKEDVFYYTYGLLHSEEYRTRYADNLTKELPRIPCVKKAEDFWAFSKAGRELAHWHLNYETVDKYPATLDTGSTAYNSLSAEDFYVEKMKFAKKGEKGTVIYNKRITIKDIPVEAYEYVVNGKPALEWVMERQCVSTHKDSGIVNDANDWANETMNNAAYPLELFLRVITVSLETMKIVRSLPKLDI